jgi:hypothetical protein
MLIAAIGTNQLRRTARRSGESTDRTRAFGVELQRPELLRLAFLVVERILLHAFLQVLQRLPSDPPGGGCTCGFCIIAMSAWRCSVIDGGLDGRAGGAGSFAGPSPRIFLRATLRCVRRNCPSPTEAGWSVRGFFR